MALKDTLARLNNEVGESGQAVRSELREDWIAAVTQLVTRIETFLEDYVRDGSISVRRTMKTLREDALGSYRVPNLVIAAGPAQIEITPVARIVAGATGRVDMHRQGRSRLERTILLLRTDSVGPDGSSLWRLYLPPPSVSSSVGVVVSRQPPQAHDFDRGSFEHALDLLLS